MPETSIVITIVVGIFSAGVTWGIMSAKQRAISVKIDTTITELRSVVQDLRSLASDVKVMSALSSRVEAQLDKHGRDIARLQNAVAKLQASAA